MGAVMPATAWTGARRTQRPPPKYQGDDHAHAHEVALRLRRAEPHIDARTMEIHHTKHHQTYVDKLNAALEKYPQLQSLSAVELIADVNRLPADIRTAVRNNGGGHVNHEMFFTMLGPKRAAGRWANSPRPSTPRSAASSSSSRSSPPRPSAHFASGWAWLSVDAGGKLLIETTPGHDSPIMAGRKPILVLDLWEHAYYLKHQNRRGDSVAAWWNVLDWEHAERNFTR